MAGGREHFAIWMESQVVCIRLMGLKIVHDRRCFGVPDHDSSPRASNRQKLALGVIGDVQD